VLTRYLGWASVFFVNVPLALAALALAFAVVPADPPRDRSRRFDLAGMLTAMSSVTLVVWALVQGPELGWSEAPVTVPVVLGMLIAWAFTRIEQRARAPLIPRALVRNAFVRLAVVLAFLFMATFGSLLYFVSIYLQNVLGYDALQTGLGFVVPPPWSSPTRRSRDRSPPRSACDGRAWPRWPSAPSAPPRSLTPSPPTPPTSTSCPA
jgi:predicted MFS family arabinose efflux permease